MTDILGFHHVAATGRRFARTRAFYENVLGLSADAPIGEPASLRLRCGGIGGERASAIVFEFEDNGAPVRGPKPIQGIALAVMQGSLPMWRSRLADFGIPITGSAWAFGEEHLCFTDPDGIELALAEDACGLASANHGAQSPDPAVVWRIKAVEIEVAAVGHRLFALAEILGFDRTYREGPVVRFQGGPPTRPMYLDLLLHRKLSPLRQAGPGRMQRVALRVADMDVLERLKAAISGRGFALSVSAGPNASCTIRLDDDCGVDLALCLGELQ